MNRSWFFVGVIAAVGLGLYATVSLLPERKTPEQLQAEQELRQRCHQAEDATRQALTRYRAGNPAGLLEAAGLVKALGVDEPSCPESARQAFASARDEIARLVADGEWRVLNSEIEPDTASALIAAWASPGDHQSWQSGHDALLSALGAARPAIVDIRATEDGEPACREESLRLSESQRIQFRRAILKRLSAPGAEHPLVTGRLADQRIAAGADPLTVDVDFQFELFADTRPGTGMRVWLPGRIELTITDGDLLPLRFSAERDVPENITSKIWYCDWAQADELLQVLLAELPPGLIAG